MIAITIDDGRKEFQKKCFKYCGLPVPEYFWGSHLSDLTPKQNCSLSHMNVVRMARHMDWDGVFIFEDDAYPCIDCGKRIKKIFDVGIPENAGLIVFGYNKNFNKKSDGVFTEIRDDKELWGSHSYLVLKCGYDPVLRAYEKSTVVSDAIFRRVQCKKFFTENLFIQYCKNKSMNGYHGYIYDNKSYSVPLSGFPKIEDVLKGCG